MKRTAPGEPSPPAIIVSAIPKQDVPARLAALPSADIRDLKQQWRSLFGTEPPPYNRRFLERRIAYRFQELAYGGLKPETIARLEALGEQIDGGNITLRRIRQDQHEFFAAITADHILGTGIGDKDLRQPLQDQVSRLVAMLVVE